MEENKETGKNEKVDKTKFLAAHSPHIWRGFSVKKVMYIVVIASLFPAAASIYYFGFDAIYVILACTITAVLTEFVIKKLRKKKFVMDGSAVITGLLLALVLPPKIPIWMAVVGSAFGIAIAKEAFGGLGSNIFNPALAGRAFLAVCFPQQMTTWTLPSFFGPDAVTGASPLGEGFVFAGDKIDLYKDIFFGNIAGSLGETSAFAILIGAIILLAFRVIDWKIPVIYIATVALGSFIFGSDVVFQIFSGGLMIGAFFMATDYATSPVTSNGRIIYAFCLGVLTVLIRQFSSLPEGVAFSILIMNSFVPLIDRYLRPKPFGYQKPKKAAGDSEK